MKGRNFWRGAVVLALVLLWPALAAAKAKPPVVAAGLNHSLTIQADGSLWACGYNILGQLGLGDTATRLVPTRVGTASDWVAVAAGGDHSLGIRADGSLWAWGYNYYGQLGIGTSDNQKNTPQQVPGYTDWVAVAAGQSHSLAIRADGSLYTWGWNQNGQLGLNHYNNKNTPQPLGGNWVAVAAGYGHSLGILANGILLTWGANSDGQLGRDTTINPQNTPLPAAGAFLDWVEVAAGQNHSLGRRANGSLYAWGYNAGGQLGLGPVSSQNTPQRVVGFLDWVKVAAGANHSLGRRADGSLWSWGDNAYGQLGLPTGNQNTPQPAGPASRDWVAVAAGGDHSHGIRADGSLYAWGANGYGQLGLGDPVNRNFPTRLALGRILAWKAVAAGSSFSLGIRDDGTLWAWGYNYYGQLGIGNTIDRHVPTRVGTHSDWVAVAARGYHSLGLRADGTLWAWGYNYYGQLGIAPEDTNNRYLPTQVGTDSYWVAVAAGDSHSLGLKADGSVWAWGWNIYGQLGLAVGDTTNRQVPTQVGTYHDWVAVAAGSFHSLGLKADSSLYTWGYNYWGQLGLGTNDNKSIPTIVPGSSKWVAVGGGGVHSLGRQANSSLYAWGRNSHGQLGLNNTTDQNTPQPVGSGSDWVPVAGGYYHSLGIRVDGSLWAWGQNLSGQLGLGGTNFGDFPTPSPVGSGTDWVEVAAGAAHSLGRRADGSLWAWGNNAHGQLGVGDTATRNTPTRVPFPGALPWIHLLLLGN